MHVKELYPYEVSRHSNRFNGVLVPNVDLTIIVSAALVMLPGSEKNYPSANDSVSSSIVVPSARYRTPVSTT